MKGFKWKVDDANQVLLKPGFFGRHRIYLNGREVANKVPWRKTNIPFFLEDGRKAEMLIIPSGFVQDRELRIEGQLILSENDLKAIVCINCGAAAQATGKFCEKCGTGLPGAESQLRMKKLKEARSTIAWVAGMFVLSGVVMYFVQKNTLATSLQNLSRFSDSDIYPNLVAGRQYTVGELRHQLAAAPLQVLATNFFLAAIMTGLYQYARKSPLVAIIMATGVYAAVQVANAIIDPMTINQGLIMKIFIFGILAKGIRSTLELRKTSA